MSASYACLLALTEDANLEGNVELIQTAEWLVSLIVCSAVKARFERGEEEERDERL
jgi:hypothetical protein